MPEVPEKSPQSPDHLMAAFFSTRIAEYSAHQLLQLHDKYTLERALIPLNGVWMSWSSLSVPCFFRLWLLVQIFFSARIVTLSLDLPVSYATSLLVGSWGVAGARARSNTLAAMVQNLGHSLSHELWSSWIPLPESLSPAANINRSPNMPHG